MDIHQHAIEKNRKMRNAQAFIVSLCFSKNDKKAQKRWNPLWLSIKLRDLQRLADGRDKNPIHDSPFQTKFTLPRALSEPSLFMANPVIEKLGGCFWRFRRVNNPLDCKDFFYLGDSWRENFFFPLELLIKALVNSERVLPPSWDREEKKKLPPSLF